MYDYISGNITFKSATYIVVEAGGVGYQLNISLQTYTRLKDEIRAKVFTHLAIKEDAHVLYGFADEEERTLFRHLISVSGVGPGTARVMLSSMTAVELHQSITTGQVAAIKRIKGIGDKTAQRIVIDLKDKLGKSEISSTIIPSSYNTAKDEALSALLALGFNRSAAEKELQKIIHQSSHNFTVEELIKAALKNL
ncbi:MAG TPA: Holliday junction branch migration protein RuvA [Bacteroidia bacterium]|mgnify:CR=1 FL=1|nr:Holliday junction branch migration protein RuvA [Bacteroidia bacterium]MBV6453682.1 Holliday junction ATP-dependent DNA helicase RuvA [Bacteroidia bacterium]HNR48117.1 Holliday junction branch migration protein RuvA [Bacteroidia bacterium]HNT81348.1 Holliday junction branch migration protein RuvA [Bacteroidia bacterium]HRV51911.1 Holliday junction branch migration protein RuvA [Bacteroidia bacterium]